MVSKVAFASTVAVFAILCFAAGFYVGIMGDVDEEATDPPYPKEGLVVVEDSWEATSVFPPDIYANTHSFRLEEGVRRIIVDYEIDLPSSDLPDDIGLPANLTFDPLVTLRVRGPDNEVMWESSMNESAIGEFSITATDGLWTLRIEARGYGFDSLGVELTDRLYVSVTAY